MREFHLKFYNSLKDIQKLIENKMKRIWVHNIKFNIKYRYKILIIYYKTLAKTSKKTNSPFNNRFNNSI